MKSDLSVAAGVYSGILNEDEPTAAGYACNQERGGQLGMLHPAQREMDKYDR